MLIDTNIIIYAINSASPKHTRAKQFLLDHQDNLILAHQNVLEAIRVLTHPKFSNPLSFSQAEKAVTAIAQAATVIAPVQDSLAIAIGLMHAYGRSQNRIFDAYLVATMLSHGIKKIATDNERDFVLFAEITVMNPFQASDRGN